VFKNCGDEAERCKKVSLSKEETKGPSREKGRSLETNLMRNDEDECCGSFHSLDQIGLSSNCERKLDSRAEEEIEGRRRGKRGKELLEFWERRAPPSKSSEGTLCSSFSF